MKGLVKTSQLSYYIILALNLLSSFIQPVHQLVLNF